MQSFNRLAFCSRVNVTQLESVESLLWRSRTQESRSGLRFMIFPEELANNSTPFHSKRDPFQSAVVEHRLRTTDPLCEVLRPGGRANERLRFSVLDEPSLDAGRRTSLDALTSTDPATQSKSLGPRAASSRRLTLGF